MLVLHWALKPQNLSVLFLTGLHAYINISAGPEPSPRTGKEASHGDWRGPMERGVVSKLCETR